MSYIPHEKMSIQWAENHKSFNLALPWVSMDIDVEDVDQAWIGDAVDHLHSAPAHQSVQRFIGNLKDYPIFYIKPRSLEEFSDQALQPCPEVSVDTSTPATFLATFGCALPEEMKRDIIPAWTWEWGKFLSNALIPGTNLYDPVSLITYLICYRQDWESTSWSGQDGFGRALTDLLATDEKKFFQTIGWVAKQSWYVTKFFNEANELALSHFPAAKSLITHFMHDEVGHYKFMEEVFDDLALKKEDFSAGEATKWLLAAHKRTAECSPLAFSAMINLFEAAFYEGQDPIARVIKLSSKPYAARGYDLHYKINQEHRHCDMPVLLAAHLTPQTYDHVALTLSLFELTLNFLDSLERHLTSAAFVHMS